MRLVLIFKIFFLADKSQPSQKTSEKWAMGGIDNALNEITAARTEGAEAKTVILAMLRAVH